VVGGGDTATEEALYLTKYGRHVNLLVRGRMATLLHFSIGRFRYIASRAER